MKKNYLMRHRIKVEVVVIDGDVGNMNNEEKVEVHNQRVLVKETNINVMKTWSDVVQIKSN